MTSLEMKQAARQLLENNILRFWLDKMQDEEHGGFYGRIDGYDVLHADADKGCVLHARILWTFAAAYRVLGNREYLDAAIRAKDYFISHFMDAEQGGVYWSVDSEGRPKDMKKQSYAIGFAIYGLSELVRATDDEQALNCAISLFEDLELHAYDEKNVGYIEAQTRNWHPISDMRLSDKDENGSRTMNTHLHILEPYTNLYRCFKRYADKIPTHLVVRLERQLRTLIGIFTQKLLNPKTGHLDLFFDDEWRGLRNIESYGHDIEAAWLLTEALEVLGDKQLMEQTMPVVNRIAHAAEEGLCPNGAMIHEKNLTTGVADTDLHWWVQCEQVIGQINQYQHFHDEAAWQKAVSTYRYIQDQLVDEEHGEWYWSRRTDGTINRKEDKAGFWKCPYHNSRMCLEIIEREF